MLFTRECDYAVRMIRAPASGEIISIHSICEREKITTAIAYKIARKLEKAGLIRSYRGNTGGYALTCDLNRLTLLDVFYAIDPNLLLTDCMQSGYECPRNRPGDPCQVHGELCRIQAQLTQSLREKSIAQILQK